MNEGNGTWQGGWSPANIRITSRVESAAANRLLVRVNLPAGKYRVVATLMTTTGQSRVVRNAFKVVPGRQLPD